MYADGQRMDGRTDGRRTRDSGREICPYYIGSEMIFLRILKVDILVPKTRIFAVPWKNGIPEPWNDTFFVLGCQAHSIWYS